MALFTIPEFMPATLANVNCRAELHGDEKVNALDLKFTFAQSNKFLDMLVPGLRQAFYRKAKGGDEQPTLDGVEPITDTPALRFPTGVQMPLKLANEYAGYRLTLDCGIGRPESFIVLASVDVAKIEADLKEGGTGQYAMRCQVKGLEADEIGAIVVQQGNEMKITLEAPAPATDKVLPGTAESPFKLTVAPGGGIVDRKPAPDPTSAFLAANELDLPRH